MRHALSKATLFSVCLLIAAAVLWSLHSRHEVESESDEALHSAFEHLQAQADATPVPRAYYGHRLEPAAPVILHGAGQSDEISFRAYSQALAPATPMLMMRYVDLRDDLPGFFRQLGLDLQRHPEFLIPQIGLSLNRGDGARHYEGQTARGDDDRALAQLCAGLQSLERPVFLRPGYEFNGPWNGYDASEYVAAFRRVAQAVRGCDADVALVWDWSPDAELDAQRSGAPAAYAAARWQQFYPGDDYVDWWGLNLFSAASIAGPATREFLDHAERARFPVMIAESTLRLPEAGGEVSTPEEWFRLYFGLLRSSRAVKAACYIDWDWRAYPQWAEWGDARIENKPSVLTLYRSQVVGNPLFANAADRASTLSLLQVSGGRAPRPALLPPTLHSRTR